ncbi:SHOCT domain-containing protein [Blastococcus sp. SYSU DS1024]
MGFGMGMGWMWLIWLLVIVAAVALTVVVVRAIGGGVTRTTGDAESGPPARSRARQLLDERYARGEMATEEYRERLQALGESE